MNEPSFNDVVTAHKDKILALRAQAIDARTTARAYLDLGDLVQEMPSKGDLWDIAQNDLVILARRRQMECSQLSSQRLVEADQLEKRGF